MTLGQKISAKRKENNITQEQLAGVLGVSRQAISKWESDTTYPETDKLIRMGELFECSMDYLLKDEIEEPLGNAVDSISVPKVKLHVRERKSEKTIHGIPLWHIGKNARGIVAVGLNATGVIAIGAKATGLLSAGLLSIGVLSFGLLSIGLIAIGLIAVGGFAAGTVALGIIAAGAFSFGILSAGAIAIGDFTFGGLARGKYFAMGDNAHAMIAIGDSKAVGSVYESTGEYNLKDVADIKMLLEQCVPGWLKWAANIVKAFL